VALAPFKSVGCLFDVSSSTVVAISTYIRRAHQSPVQQACITHLQRHTHLVQQLCSEDPKLVCQLGGVHAQLVKQLLHEAGMVTVGRLLTCSHTTTATMHLEQ